MRLPNPPKSIPVRLFGLVLSLWLGGVGCLAGSIKMLVETSGPEINSAQTKSHSCCHQKRQKAEESAEERVSNSTMPMNCCPLAGQRAVVNCKQQLPDSTPCETSQKIVDLERVTVVKLSHPRFQASVHNRTGTHLRNCTFLI